MTSDIEHNITWSVTSPKIKEWEANWITWQVNVNAGQTADYSTQDYISSRGQGFSERQEEEL